MLDRILEALARSPADFTEVRVERSWVTTVAFRGRRLEGAAEGRDAGGTVRCLVHGRGWGSVTVGDLAHLDAAVRRAHELALVVRPPEPVRLAPVAVHVATDPPPLADDPRDVPLAEKRRYLEHLNGEMLRADRRIVDTQAAYRDEVVEAWYANSEGTRLHQRRPDVTLAALAVAREGGVVERAVESLGARAGWRRVQEQEALFRAAAARAVGLLGAHPVRSGTFPVVLDPRLAATLVHETIGHLAEADAQLEDPRVAHRAWPGRTVGSPLLTVGDDGSAAGLRGTLAFDDEGTPSSNTLLVQHGVVVGRLHSRETAGRTGERPTGNARAVSWRRPPLVRPTNTYVAAGSGTFADLLRDVKLGVYACDAVASRTRLGEFALTAGYGFMIRNGELAEPVKHVTVAGELGTTLGAVDAIAADFRWIEGGGGCTRHGQGPLPVTTGAPHVRLRAAEVRGQAP